MDQDRFQILVPCGSVDQADRDNQWQGVPQLRHRDRGGNWNQQRLNHHEKCFATIRRSSEWCEGCKPGFASTELLVILFPVGSLKLLGRDNGWTDVRVVDRQQI